MNNNIEAWNEKLAQFKDPVYGYIGVPKTYAKMLIDTRYMQRLKGVAQSGIRSLFSSATHDRFSHSLGVYMFADKAYNSLISNMFNIIDKNTNLNNESRDDLKDEIKSWKCLIDIAALLHDIGHPAGSHSFEFLYDDCFLQLDDGDQDIIDLRSFSMWKKQFSKNMQTFKDLLSSDSMLSYENSKFKKDLESLIIDGNRISELNGNPHERMSAYIILKDMELNETIKKVIYSYWNNIDCKKYNIDNDIEFICRMIIGQDYLAVYSAEFCLENYKKSIKNCMIRLINGVLDADSMDYLMRNSYSAGYATHVIDYDRLCSAFDVLEKENIMEFCFSKTVLSVIEGFIAARNFEPKWLYSHHKVVYYDVLVKSMYHYSAKFLCYLDCMHFRDEIESCDEVKNELKKDFDLEYDYTHEHKSGYYMMSSWSYPYYSYIIAPRLAYLGNDFRFFTTVDADLDALFKSISLYLKNTKIDDENNKIFNKEDKEIFEILLNEYENRKLKKSLWKSYSEYRLLIREVAHSLGVSENIIHEYMMDMIINGLERWNFAIDQDASKTHPNSYKEQYIYRPYQNGENIGKHLDVDDIDYFTLNNVNSVFGSFKNKYEFSRNYCSCKIYSAKFKKNFDKLNINFYGKLHKLSSIIDIPSERSFEFPYIFYFSDSEVNCNEKNVRDSFIENFKQYCNKKICCESSTKGKMPMINLVAKQHVIRDVVHGDITFSNEFWDIVNTKEFQRLRRIKQLATASQVFPNAIHTRFAHSIGTYHIMKKIVEHFQQLFDTLYLNNNDIQNDSHIALLAALLHDIGHGPFSHAFESVAPNSRHHEAWAEKIILDEETEINNKIVEHFGSDAPQKVVNCINNVVNIENKQINFSMIYSGLVSGPLDADRMDYLMRDAYNTTRQFEPIDIQNIISSMRITQIDGIYYVCFDEDYLSYIEQLIFTRYEMYSNIYFNSYKVLSESLVKHILQRAYDKRNKLDNEDVIKMLENIFDAEMNTENFLKLDDHLINYLFHQWMDNKNDIILSEMCRALIDRTLYTEIDVEDQSALLISGIKKICEIDAISNSKEEMRSFGIIKENKETYVYPEPDNEGEIKSQKRIWIMKKNGTVVDFRNQTKLYNNRQNIDFKKSNEKEDKNFWRIYKSYVYYSEVIMRNELNENNIMRSKAGLDELNIDDKIREIKTLIESFVPRNHIEIEEKYRCSEETLGNIEQKIENGEFKPFILKPESTFKEIQQIDTYYDTIKKDIQREKATVRIREKGNEYICTVKLPVNSDNFGGNSQFARFEYEMSRDSGDLCGFADFINTHLNINGKPIINKIIDSNNINELLEETLTIENKRRKAMIVRENHNDNFSCEVCLDSVEYKKGTLKEKDYQVEIELKSDYLHHVVLKVFTNKLEHEFEKDLLREENSKYVRGLSLIDSKK